MQRIEKNKKKTEKSQREQQNKKKMPCVANISPSVLYTVTILLIIQISF